MTIQHTGASSSTQCLQIVLPAFINPLSDLSRLFALAAAAWQSFERKVSVAKLVRAAHDVCDMSDSAVCDRRGMRCSASASGSRMHASLRAGPP